MDDFYLPRVVDSELDEKLGHARAVVVRGPKWCGKTMTSERHAASAVYLQDPSVAQRYRAAARVDPSLLLEGDEPRLMRGRHLRRAAHVPCAIDNRVGTT